MIDFTTAGCLCKRTPYTYLKVAKDCSGLCSISLNFLIVALIGVLQCFFVFLINLEAFKRLILLLHKLFCIFLLKFRQKCRKFSRTTIFLNFAYKSKKKNMVNIEMRWKLWIEISDGECDCVVLSVYCESESISNIKLRSKLHLWYFSCLETNHSTIYQF